MKTKLFNTNIDIKNKSTNFIDSKKLNKIKNEVDILLEMKICKICRKKKIIYDFQIDRDKDEYMDICISCNIDDYEKICYECKEKKRLDEFYCIRDRGYTKICKNCIKIKVSKYNHFKECVQCNKKLPANDIFFKIHSQYNDYLDSSCRVCRGLKYKMNIR